MVMVKEKKGIINVCPGEILIQMFFPFTMVSFLMVEFSDFKWVWSFRIYLCNK